MVKPPVVHLAGMLRALGRYVDTDAWTWLLRPDRAGRSSGRPTSPAGTTPAGSTPRGCGPAGTSSTTCSTSSRVDAWDEQLQHHRDAPRKRSPARSPPGAIRRCATSTAAELLDFARRAEKRSSPTGSSGPYRAMRQNALLQLIGVSPDLILQ